MPQYNPYIKKQMRILIVSDAWHPQINGVVRTLTETIKHLRAFGHHVKLISPQAFKTLPCPTYPEIRLALLPYRQLSHKITAFQPDAIHIATEGPLGLGARKWCIKHHKPFTTAYHTQFPEYVHQRVPLIPLSWLYAAVRWFHRPSKQVMIPTPAVKKQLQDQGLNHLSLWARGVDLQRFYPSDRNALDHFCKTAQHRQGPKFICIGRVAVEKNIEAFLSLDLPGSKWIIGDGPARKELQQKYPEVYFLGSYPQAQLPPFYNAADVFVFPSQTDTFGLVMLEAMACGTPVAAFPVTGPIDVISDSTAGVLDKDLQKACLKALNLNRSQVATFAKQHSWEKTTQQFEYLLQPLNPTTEDSNQPTE